MKTRIAVTFGLIALIILAACITCAAYDPNWKKSQTDTYSYHGLGETYYIGGDYGWIDNNAWDGWPSEGSDCSDYAPRCLALPNYVGEHTHSGHPYTTGSLHSGIANMVQVGSVNSLQQWDMWVWTGSPYGHCGLFKQYSGTSIITREARGSSFGIVEYTRSKQSLIDQGSRYWRRASWGAEGPTMRLDVFARGTNNDIYQITWTNTGGWTDLTSIGAPSGGATSDPACVSRQSGIIDVYVRGADGQCYHRWYSGGAWSPGWVSIGGNIVGAPDVCAWDANRTDVFARGTNNLLYQITWTSSGGWGNWVQVNPSEGVYSDPSAVSWGSGRIDVFFKGSAGDILHKAYVSGYGWYPVQSMGGGLIDGPDACAWAANRLDVFVRGTNDDLYINSWNGSAWSGWNNEGGTISSGPGCASHSSGSFDVFARGGNGSDDLYHISYSSGGWSDWGSLGGNIVGGPDACSWTNP